MGKTKSDSITSTFAQRMKDESARQKEAKTERGPIGLRIVNFLKVWGVRAFHTVFFLSIVYFVVLFCMMIIPMTMGYVLGGLGYNLNNAAEQLLALLSGLFFSAWVFFGSYKLIAFVGKFYIKNCKKAGNKSDDKDEPEK